MGRTYPEPIETNKEDLSALIDYAEEAKEDPSYKYVVAKVKEMFEKALKDAKEKKDKPDATQAEVDVAYAEVGDSASGNGSVSDEKDETLDKVTSDDAGSKTTSTGKKTSDKAAKTGDGANTALPAATGLAAILAVLLAWKKK